MKQYRPPINMTSFLLSGLKLVLIFCMAVLLISAHCSQSGLQFERKDPERSREILDFVRLDGSNAASIVIEIADTPEARSKGLMGRQTLNITNGMLFIYEQEAVRGFWMHNTPISLDIIFVDKEKRIFHIAESTVPMSKQTYSSKGPAQYVVEVPSGFVNRFNIRNGMRIQWRH